MKDIEDWNKTEKCACCNREIKMYPDIRCIDGKYVNLHEGLMYHCGCWCGRHWCSKECAKKDDWVFVGDSYDTDYVGCKYCHDEKRRVGKFIP